MSDSNAPVRGPSSSQKSVLSRRDAVALKRSRQQMIPAGSTALEAYAVVIGQS
jgi:hypothetical protein